MPEGEPQLDRPADQLVRQLRVHGHDVEHVRLPFSLRDWHTIPAQMVAARNFQIDGADRLIALEFPAYLLRHEDKVVWLAEDFLAGDDGFVGATEYGTPSESHYRDLRYAADSEGLGEARSLFSTSTAVADRLRDHRGLDSAQLSWPTAGREGLASSTSWGETIERLLK